MGSATATMIVSLVPSSVIVLGLVLAVRRGVTAAEFLVVISLAMMVCGRSGRTDSLLPLTPFLLFYLVTGIQRLVPGPAPLRVLLLAALGLHVLDHAQHAVARHRRCSGGKLTPPKWTWCCNG